MRRKYTIEVLNPIVSSSYSFAEVLRKLELKQSGGSQQHIKTTCKLLKIDVSHFTGQSWANGSTRDRYVGRTDAELFSKNTIYHNKLHRTRLIKSGREYKCELCNLLPIWNNEPLTLHLDHKMEIEPIIESVIYDFCVPIVINKQKIGVPKHLTEKNKWIILIVSNLIGRPNGLNIRW